MIERDVKNKVKRIIAKYEQEGHVFWSYWPVQTGYGKHGIPDCLLCFKGWLIAIECKVDGKQPTMRQQHEMGGIVAAGAVGIFVDQSNLPDVETVFALIIEGDIQGARKHAVRSRSLYTEDPKDKAVLDMGSRTKQKGLRSRTKQKGLRSRTKQKGLRSI